jgi:hypothetical protein
MDENEIKRILLIILILTGAIIVSPFGLSDIQEILTNLVESIEPFIN